MKWLFIFTFSLPTIIFSQNKVDFTYSMTECQGGGDLDQPPVLVSLEKKRDSLFLEIKGMANCSGIHDVQLVENSDTLLINFEEGALYRDTLFAEELSDTINSENEVLDGYFTFLYLAECDCCYTFYFQMPHKQKLPDNQIILFNGEICEME